MPQAGAFPSHITEPSHSAAAVAWRSRCQYLAAATAARAGRAAVVDRSSPPGRRTGGTGLLVCLS